MMADDLIIEPCEFWFVWTKKGHIPHFRHDTEASALAEAERLARLKPTGKKFIVLRSVVKMHVPPTPAGEALTETAPAEEAA